MLFEFFISCIFHPNYYTDYFFSFIGITLSIISLIFFPFERFNQFYFQHVKSTQLIFFCCYQMQFFSGTKVHKKVYYPPTTMICFAQKEKVLYERERLWWEEPIHFFELSYLLFRSEWMNLLQYTQSMYKNRVKKDKILFLKFLLLKEEIQNKAENEMNRSILNFPCSILRWILSFTRYKSKNLKKFQLFSTVILCLYSHYENNISPVIRIKTTTKLLIKRIFFLRCHQLLYMAFFHKL